MHTELMIYIDSSLHPDQEALPPHIRLDLQCKLNQLDVGREYLATFGQTCTGDLGITIPGVDCSFPGFPFWFRPSRFIKSNRGTIFSELLLVRARQSEDA